MDNNIKDRKVFISVILPVYNVEKYITKCVESLIHQSFKDLEFIFIGDSGTDHSMRIVEEYKKKDDRIVVLYNETNLGPGLSRNKGLDIAKGDYISFVDPDDWLDPHFYENLYARALESKCDIIKGNARRIDEEGNDITATDSLAANKRIRTGKGKKPLYLLFDDRFSTAIYKREFLRKESISFPPLRVGEDSVFLLQACIACNDIAFCDDAIYFYCMHSDSITNTNNYQKQIYALEALKARIEQLNPHGFDEFAYIYLSKVSTYYLTNFKQYLENNQKASRETAETYLGEYEAIISSLDDPQAVFTNVDSYQVLKAYTNNHNNDVKVSVILPLYKCAQYMRSLLDSVCGQTFRETEIICVLDGPDEEIRTIIEDRAKFDARIICLEQEHGNAGTARNTGMAIAKGEYLLFLDADEIDDLYNRILCVPWNKLFRHQMITEQHLRFSGTRISNDFFFVCAAMTCAKWRSNPKKRGASCVCECRTRTWNYHFSRVRKSIV